MKKVINFAVAGLFAVVLFAACRENTTTETNTETTTPVTEQPTTPQVDTTQTAVPADTTQAPQ